MAIEECQKKIESLAAHYYCIDNGYKYIDFIIPQNNITLGTPLYISSCFKGEECIAVRRIICHPDGMSIGCILLSEYNNCYVVIDDDNIQTIDLIKVLELLEMMSKQKIANRYIRISYEY